MEARKEHRETVRWRIRMPLDTINYDTRQVKSFSICDTLQGDFTDISICFGDKDFNVGIEKDLLPEKYRGKDTIFNNPDYDPSFRPESEASFETFCTRSHFICPARIQLDRDLLRLTFLDADLNSFPPVIRIDNFEFCGDGILYELTIERR